jgi:SAM-dependent methyltransferase
VPAVPVDAPRARPTLVPPPRARALTAAAAAAPTTAFDDVSIVVPHGGAARLRNLTVMLQAIKTAAIATDVVVVEMDEIPRAQALVEQVGFRYVFAEQGNAFHKARAMNAGIPFVRSSRFFWIDSDLLITAAFLRAALAEFETRSLDCLVPWTSVRYLSEEDSDAVAAATRSASECTPVNTYYTRAGCRGGISLVRTDFVRRYGGVCEEFQGWGGEDNAWFIKASVLGRAAATSRQDQHVYHVYHPRSGGYGPPVAIASNPNYQRNLALLHEVRRLTRRDRFLARFPAPAHHTAPWLGVRTVACAAAAAAVGEALQAMYGPAVEIRSEGERADAAVAAADLVGTTALEVARSVASRLTVTTAPPAGPPRTEVDLPEDSPLTLPLPWADDSVDSVRAHDVIGLLPDRIQTMNELWRILRAGGTAEISVLTTDGPGAFAHPASRTFWNRSSFDWFVAGHHQHAQSGARFGIRAAFNVTAEDIQPTPRGPRLTITLTAVKGATSCHPAATSSTPVPNSCRSASTEERSCW